MQSIEQIQKQIQKKIRRQNTILLLKKVGISVDFTRLDREKEQQQQRLKQQQQQQQLWKSSPLQTGLAMSALQSMPGTFESIAAITSQQQQQQQLQANNAYMAKQAKTNEIITHLLSHETCKPTEMQLRQMTEEQLSAYAAEVRRYDEQMEKYQKDLADYNAHNEQKQQQKEEEVVERDVTSIAVELAKHKGDSQDETATSDIQSLASSLEDNTLPSSSSISLSSSTTTTTASSTEEEDQGWQESDRGALMVDDNGAQSTAQNVRVLTNGVLKTEEKERKEEKEEPVVSEKSVEEKQQQ